jgi:hypothetical protein
MEIFSRLDKSNCRQCGEKTCLAFAGAVFTGRKKLDECPKLDRDVLKRFSDEGDDPVNPEDNWETFMAAAKKALSGIDLAETAERIGGSFQGNQLIVKVLGKNFGIDTGGSLFAEIHVNPWVAGPLLNYVLRGKGSSPSGNWVSYRELNDGRERYPLFQKRCEEAMKRVADSYPDLFDDMVHIFGGKQVEKQFESDISVVLHPLPKLPIMICYWAAEDGLESSLNVFFDKTADQNLDAGSVFTLAAGLARMFEKLAQRHGFFVAKEK